MEIFGGFMVMISIIGLFLAVVWLIMPFAVIAIKGKQDRSLELLETIEKRLTAIDKKLTRLHSDPASQTASASPPENDDRTASEHNMQTPALPLD